MSDRFNPPPSWPEPPHDGWRPPADFRPARTWGAVPAGWRLWVEEGPGARRGRGAVASPLQDSEDVPASGARPRERVESYPVSVINPGMWSQNHLEDEDYGFGPAPERRDRPRLRLALTIVVTVLGFLVAGATAVGFVWLVDFAVNDLTGVLGAASSLAAGSATGA